MAAFIPGLDLCELFFAEAVKPILEREFPELAYAAALIGPGSEVLGFDTPQSMDHHWGPKTQLFLSEGDEPRYADAIKAALRDRLPYTVRGISTNFGPPDEIGVQLLRPIDSGPVNHLVYVHTVRGYFSNQLGFDIAAEPAAADWLTFPQQKLLELMAGRVFCDARGELTAMRARFAYYPHDLWLYLLAAQWMRISQEEAFVGRCGDAGDELGSRLIAGRIVRDLMRLCFLMERTYAPYGKWLGTAFSRLEVAPSLQPLLSAALAARTWKIRERQLCRAYELVAERHNRLGVTSPLATATSRYYERPYTVINAQRFAAAIQARITDEVVRRLPPYVGSVDQFVDATDVLQRSPRARRLRAMFE